MLNLFYYEIDGLIELVPDAGQTTNTYQNFKDQEGYGFEVEMDWQANKQLRLNSSFAFQRSKDKATKEIVPYAPEINFSAGLHWEFMPDCSLNSQYYLVVDRHRAAGDTRPDIKDNDLVNLTLRRKNIAENWDIAIAVRNLFDEHILEPSTPLIPNDYPMESRAIWVEMRLHY